jgi:hypothetical protein
MVSAKKPSRDIVYGVREKAKQGHRPRRAENKEI